MISFCVFAQVNIDSLWNTWNDENAPDTSRAQAMFKISWNGYLFSQPDSAIYLAQLLYDFAENKGLRKEMARAIKIKGVSNYIRGNYPQALDYYQQSLMILEEIQDTVEIAKCLNNIGLVYTDLSDYPQAEDFYNRSLMISEKISNKNGIASALNNLGNIYAEQSNYFKSLSYYERSLDIYGEISEKVKMAGILNNIGLISMELEDYPKALEYYKRYLEISEEMSDKRRMSGALNNIGLIYMNTGDYSKALQYFEKSLLIREQIHDKKGAARTLNNIGSVHNQQGMLQLALEYYNRSLKIRDEISDKRGLTKTLNNIGMINIKQGNYLEAIKWCKQGLQISEGINIIEEKKNACKCLYDGYKALGNDNKSLEYHERLSILDDSLKVIETAKKLQQIEFAKEMLADSLRKEEEKLKVQIAHEAQVRKKNRTRNIYIIAAVFLLIFAIGYHRRMVLVRKAKRAIDKEKDRSDNLLLNILPPEIAEELKEKGRAEARNYEKVSILFTDFKGFTQISEKLSAEELVEEINTCFQEFDAICKKHGVEKIKTIGDAYMAAGGLPVPRENSVRNTVLAGLEMMDFMIHKRQKCQDEGSLCFEMRLGIHTGSVVAGIVGITKFQYDIWGDAVNIASRMENSGEVGKVNISGSTREIIKDDPAFQFQPRGKVSTKGKGDIDMWFVEKTIDH